MHYTIYKVTNQIDGKFYIGTHKTKDLNDGYFGSGKYLKRAQAKHGIENFIKEILYVFDTPEEMFAKEAELVTPDFLTFENTYNLKVGGMGGFDHINTNVPSRILKNKKARAASNITVLERYGVHNIAQIDYVRKAAAERGKQLHAEGKSFLPPPLSFKGKQHTAESKALISAAMIGRCKGELNSQFGSMWITNGRESKKIDKLADIPEGWRKGRVVKNMEC